MDKPKILEAIHPKEVDLGLHAASCGDCKGDDCNGDKGGGDSCPTDGSCGQDC